MNEGITSSSGGRFANDLRKIRESRGISIEDLYNETKIPRGLLEAFEETGLFDHPMFNRVYLRSFVRTYAEVVGIPADRVIDSLEDALEERYQGGLVREFIGGREGEQEPAAGSEPVSREEKPVPPPPVKKEENERYVRETPDEPEDVPPVEAPPTYPRKFETPSQPVSAAAEPRRPQPVPVTDWDAQSPPPSAFQREPQSVDERSPWLRWALIAFAVVVFGGILWLLFFQTGRDDSRVEGNIENVAQSDTLAENQQIENATSVMLSDTLRATIIAANDRVQNIKVTVDNDVRRPYWIELRESRTFPFRDQIIIERQLGKIDLQVEGQSYPTDRRDELDRIVITRDSVRAFLGVRTPL